MGPMAKKKPMSNQTSTYVLCMSNAAKDFERHKLRLLSVYSPNKMLQGSMQDPVKNEP